MKKITPYFSDSRSLNESRRDRKSSKKAVNESAYDEYKELYTDRDISKVLLSAANNNLVCLIGQERGNQLVPTIEQLCDDLDLDAASISCRSIRENRALIDELYEATESLIIITDAEIAVRDNRMIKDLVDFMNASESSIVVVTSSMDDVVDSQFGDLFGGRCYFYVPQYDRISTYKDEYDDIDESVSQRFAKYRKLYEDENINEDDDDADADDDSSDDNSSDDSSSDDNNDSDDNSSDDSSDDNSSEDDDTVDVPMTAVVLTVKKEDADKCKDELIEAGIPEDNIEVIEGEEDDEDVQIKVDADSVKELKDYLSGKGIDLEEKIGGEIIDDEEESNDNDDSSDDSSDDDNKDKSDDEEEMNFDDEFGDLFGDEE